jgi:hypothetical protein
MSLLQTNGEEGMIQRRQLYTTSESQAQFPQSPAEGGGKLNDDISTPRYYTWNNHHTPKGSVRHITHHSL